MWVVVIEPHELSKRASIRNVLSQYFLRGSLPLPVNGYSHPQVGYGGESRAVLTSCARTCWMRRWHCRLTITLFEAVQLLKNTRRSRLY